MNALQVVLSLGIVFAQAINLGTQHINVSFLQPHPLSTFLLSLDAIQMDLGMIENQILCQVRLARICNRGSIHVPPMLKSAELLEGQYKCCSLHSCQSRPKAFLGITECSLLFARLSSMRIALVGLAISIAGLGVASFSSPCRGACHHPHPRRHLLT